MCWFWQHHVHGGKKVSLKVNNCALGETYEAWRFDCCKCDKKWYATGGYDSSYIWNAKEA